MFRYSSDIEEYLDNLKSYYGDKNVYIGRTRVSKRFEHSLLSALRHIMFSEFTTRELKVLHKSYQTG